MDKKAELRRLATKRQTYTLKGPNRQYAAEYNNIGDPAYAQGRYECDFVSPYTKTAGNVDSPLMVFLQDWASDGDLRSAFVQDRVTLGYNSQAPTNRKLIQLLRVHFCLSLNEIYVTNLFPFVKMGGRSSSIPKADMVRAAKEFGLPQLDSVSPKLAICLGLDTYNAMRAACSLNDIRPLSVAIGSHFPHGKSKVYCLAHPAVRPKDRSPSQVNQDWANAASLYRNIP